MRNAKAFFFICGGILMLVAAYNLGATVAMSQSGDSLTAVGNSYLGTAAGDVYRVLGGSVNREWTRVGNLGAGPVVFVQALGTGYFDAYIANGDYYWSNDDGLTWTRLGNVFSGQSTLAAQQTWGSVKARYRPGAGAATQGK